MFLALTGVQRSEGSSVIKEATVVGQAVFQVVVIEGKGGRSLDVVRVVAWTAILDWTAVSGSGPAYPVQGRLQSCILRVVLGHAPQLRANDAVLGPRNCSLIREGGTGEREIE